MTMRQPLFKEAFFNAAVKLSTKKKIPYAQTSRINNAGSLVQESFLRQKEGDRFFVHYLRSCSDLGRLSLKGRSFRRKEPTIGALFYFGDNPFFLIQREAFCRSLPRLSFMNREDLVNFFQEQRRCLNSKKTDRPPKHMPLFFDHFLFHAVNYFSDRIGIWSLRCVLLWASSIGCVPFYHLCGVYRSGQHYVSASLSFSPKGIFRRRVSSSRSLVMRDNKKRISVVVRRSVLKAGDDIRQNRACLNVFRQTVKNLRFFWW